MCSGASPASLHDELAEVGLDDLDAGSLEALVQVDLLGRHRLALDRHPAVAEDDVGDVGRRIGPRGRPVDDGTRGLQLLLERVEERRKVGDRTRPGRLACRAERLEVDAAEPADAVVGRPLGEPGHVGALVRIGECRGRARLEAAHSASATTVARWTTLTPAPTRDARPSICITHPGSALATTPAETAAAEASLSSAIAVDTSG